MLGLMFNVMPHRVAIGRAHAESPVSFLPCKIEPMLAQPAGRIRFQDLDRLRQRHGRWQDEQQVSMIRGASRAENGDVVALTDSNEVHGKFLAQFIGYGSATLFCAEYTMNQNVRVGMSHRCRPLRDSICFRHATRHCRAGLSHRGPTALPRCRSEANLLVPLRLSGYLAASVVSRKHCARVCDG
jgi:hypothetical protein